MVKKSSTEVLARKLLVAGDSARLKILCILFEDNDVCVSEIAKELGMSVATVSHHLQVLSEAGFLKPLREGKRVCYVILESQFNKELKAFICKNK